MRKNVERGLIIYEKCNERKILFYAKDGAEQVNRKTEFSHYFYMQSQMKSMQFQKVHRVKGTKPKITLNRMQVHSKLTLKFHHIRRTSSFYYG